MTLRWDYIDVDDVIVIMYDVYVHKGCSDHVDIPSGRNKVVKEF